MRKLAEAEELNREGVQLARRAWGEDSLHTAMSMSSLAGTLWHKGELAEAEELYRRTLDIRRRVLGDQHPDTLSSMNDVAETLQSRGRLTEAEALSRQALPLARKAVEKTGGRNPSFVDTLALAYKMTGDIDRAVETQRRALPLLPANESQLRTELESRLLSDLKERGDDEGAESLRRDILARTRQAHGEKHAKLVRQMTDLALLVLAEGRYHAHDELCRQLTHLRCGVIPRHEPGIAYSVVALASSLVEQDKCAEAEPFLRQCLEIEKAALPEGDWAIARTMSLLRAALAGQGEFTEAEPLLLGGHHQMEKNAKAIAADEREARLHEALGHIVNLYEAWGKPDKAAEYRSMLPAPTDLASPAPIGQEP